MIRTRLLALCVCLSSATCVREESDPSGIEEQDDPLTVPSGFVNETVATGLSNPTAMTFAPDGRLFVCEQAGALRVIENGVLLSAPFVTVPVDPAGERGLLGVTFDPAFASNRFVYIYYTATTPNLHNRLSRFTASGNTAVAGSEVVLLDLDPLTSATNHNGGAIAFGADQKLYVAVGENATRANAQSFANLLGKMLRLNADGSIPSDNPFFTTASGKNRLIWALGLRNPFTFAVQPGTGTIFINDVGENSWEEINRGMAGANYGWPTSEGATSDTRFKTPLVAYGHGTSSSTGCAITGGAFYNPPTARFPSSYVGKYFFADYCSQWIRVFDPAAGGLSDFAMGVSAPVDLDVGADGALYYLARGAGAVGRIRAAGSQAPQITAQPQDQRRAVGQPVTFTVTANGDASISYRWQRNGVNIAGATSPSYTIAAVGSGDNDALFRAVVSNPFGSATSAAARLTVVAGSPPSPVIVAPATDATYAAGQALMFSGTASDPEDGNLPGSAFTWEIVFHHDGHTHPFMLPTSGVTDGSRVIPNRGETATTVFYRVHLTVTDSTGLSATTFRDISPRTSTMMLETAPAGLQLVLDGQTVLTPTSVTSVVGLIRSVGVVSPQSQNGTSYSFSAWSDGGPASHEIPTPAANTTYRATFSAGAAGMVIPAGGGTVTGTTSGGSASAGSCAGESANAPEKIYKWTPNVSGAATIHTCNAQVKFDTVVYVATEGSPSSQLACNDDTSGCATGDPSANAGHHGSRVTLQVVAGRTYMIFVDGFAGSSGGAQGAFALTVVAPPPPPPNDAGPPPSDAGAPPPGDAGSGSDAGAPADTRDTSTSDAGSGLVMPPGGGTVSGRTSGQSRSSGTCAASATGAAPDQSVEWTPSRSGHATASTCSAQITFDTVLYARNAPGGGQELACNDDTVGCTTGDGSPNAGQHGSRIAFDVVAGQTYYFVVDGYAGSSGGSAGNFVLTVTLP